MRETESLAATDPAAEDIFFGFEDDGDEGSLEFDLSEESLDVEAECKRNERREKVEKSSSNKALEKRRRQRTSLKIESSIVKSRPPPTWHCEAADASHRRLMCIDILQLLQSRKAQKSPAWIRRVSFQVRHFESCLYKTAPSFQAYVDRKTLRSRLGRIAVNIFRQHKAKKSMLRAMRTIDDSPLEIVSECRGGGHQRRNSICSVGSLGVSNLSIAGPPTAGQAAIPLSVPSAQVNPVQNTAPVLNPLQDQINNINMLIVAQQQRILASGNFVNPMLGAAGQLNVGVSMPSPNQLQTSQMLLQQQMLRMGNWSAQQ